MMLNTGCRTDIPAYYSDWFCNRIRAGYVMTRNPYRPEQVLKYRLDPEVVDVLCFCTKNPRPMLARFPELCAFRQFWFVTVTPYGKEIEPNVPHKPDVLDAVKELSAMVGQNRVGWRYDPVFITEKYSAAYHIRAFQSMAERLCGYISSCVVSFIDLYEKTKRNFPQVTAVGAGEQELLIREFVKIGQEYHISIRTCCENPALAKYGADVSGCMTKRVLEAAAGCHFAIPKARKSSRAACDCLLGADIGMYNSCPHGCVYCYANYDRKTVAQNLRKHDPESPLLIGNLQPNDHVIEAKQESYLTAQLTLFDSMGESGAPV